MAGADTLPRFLWLTERDVTSLINLSGVIAALERALVLEAEGKARNMYKAQTVWDQGSTNVTGAQFVSALSIAVGRRARPQAAKKPSEVAAS